MGAGLAVIGAVLVIPALVGIRATGRSQWKVDGGTTKLRSRTFVVAGDKVRAAEIYRRITAENDAMKWPLLNPNRSKGRIRVGVHVNPQDQGLVITLWMLDGDDVLCWPLIEPTAASNTDTWLRGLERNAYDGDALHSLSNQLQNLDD